MQNITILFCVMLILNSLSSISFSQLTENLYSDLENTNNLDDKKIELTNLENVSLSNDLKVNNKNTIEIKTLKKHKLKAYNELIVYDDKLILLAKDYLYLYNKDLIVNWQASLTTDNFKELYAEFDTIYSINQNNSLTTFSINSGIKQTLNSINLDSFVVKHPFLLAQHNKTLKMIDLNSQDILWSKQLNCDEKIIFSSAKLTGCLTKNKLVVYDTISGEKVNKLVDSKLRNLSYISSTNSNVFLKSKKGKIININLENLKISTSEYKMNNMEFILRQKELIKIADEKNIECIDLNSKKIKWKKEFNQPIQDVVANQNFILVKLPSRNIKIIDNFTGKDIYTFSTKEELTSIDMFYNFKNFWYLINNDSHEIMTIK